MKKTVLLLFSIVFTSLSVLAQTGYDKRAITVINANRPQRLYIFANKDGSKGYFTYLGQLHSRKNTIFKVVNSTWVWGLSHRATNRILIFDRHNKYLGNYYLTIIDDLPTSITGNKLIFKNKNGSDCDVNVVSTVDFNDGIPKEFFRNCKVDMGDTYKFEKAD